jgi:hypothetical protein
MGKKTAAVDQSLGIRETSEFFLVETVIESTASDVLIRAEWTHQKKNTTLLVISVIHLTQLILSVLSCLKLNHYLAAFGHVMLPENIGQIMLPSFLRAF